MTEHVIPHKDPSPVRHCYLLSITITPPSATNPLTTYFQSAKMAEFKLGASLKGHDDDVRLPHSYGIYLEPNLTAK